MDLSSEDNETLRNNTIEKNNDLKKFYNELDNVCTNYRNCTRKTINSTSDEHTIKLYKKFDYNIFKFVLLSELRYKNSPQDVNKRCSYFKYWFYDQIIRYNLDDEKVGYITDPLKHEKDIIEFSIENVDINPRKCYIHVLKLDDIKKMKVLYDFLESYDVNEKKSNINEKICKSKLKNYLEDIISNYNQLISCNIGSTGYCEEIKECKKIYKIDELSMLHCNADQAQSFSETGSKDGHSGLRTAEGSSLHLQQPEDGVPPSDPSSEGIIPYTGVTTVSSLAVTSVILFILYKVTPLGILLRRPFQNVTNILPNINENASQELLDHVSLSDSVNIDNISNYIAYHPS